MKVKKELQKLVENSFRELLSLRFETFFILFLFLFLSIFHLFHLLFLVVSFLVLVFHVYELKKQNQKEGYHVNEEENIH